MGDEGESEGPTYVRRRAFVWLFLCVLLYLLLALPASAQEGDITDDDVNAVAAQMYCPVCPNETLDVCQTQACSQWRAEIRTQLSEGQTTEQIIDAFARRYGERVRATPQDPTLRALSVYTPFVIAGLALVIGVLTFRRWRRPVAAETPLPPAGKDGSYRDQLERDLSE